MNAKLTQKKLVEVCHQWLGTPFLENASLRGIGCDCVGLLEGVLGEFNIPTPPRKGMDLPNGLSRVCDEIAIEALGAGDILLFNSFYEAPIARTFQYHCAILVKRQRIIHAHWSQGVVENTYGNWFSARTIGAFRIKGLIYG